METNAALARSSLHSTQTGDCAVMPIQSITLKLCWSISHVANMCVSAGGHTVSPKTVSFIADVAENQRVITLYSNEQRPEQ